MTCCTRKWRRVRFEFEGSGTGLPSKCFFRQDCLAFIAGIRTEARTEEIGFRGRGHVDGSLRSDANRMGEGFTMRGYDAALRRL